MNACHEQSRMARTPSPEPSRRVLENFDLLAEAPNGVPKLREMILQLAVRGKLVEQAPKDEPVRFLVEKMLATRMKRIKNGEIRDSDHLPAINIGETPYVIPTGWEWVRIGSAINMVNGKAFKPHEWTASGIPIVRIQNLNNPDAPFNHCDFEVPPKFHIRTGDFLISWSGTPGTSFGAFIWTGGPAILNQHIFRCEMYGGLLDQYLRLAVNAQLDEMISRAHGGVGLRHITKGKLEHMLITLPPFAEQKRIVARVDELMKRCDELEARQKERNERRTALTASCLHALTSKPETRNLPARRSLDEGGKPDTTSVLARVLDNFPLLIDTPESVAQLRKTILQLAVQGRLVKQDQRDESTESLLAHLSETHVNEQKPPQSLPHGWYPVKIGSLGQILGGGTPPKGREDLWSGDLPWVSPKDMKVQYLDTSIDHIARRALSETAVRLVPPRSLLVVVRGMILAHTFPAAVNTAEVTINQDMKALVPHIPETVDYLLLACRGHAEQILSLVGRSSHGTCKLDTERLFGFVIGLPPLAEQKRIVVRVNDLMALCDELEARLTQSREDADTVAGTVVHHLCDAHTWRANVS